MYQNLISTFFFCVHIQSFDVPEHDSPVAGTRGKLHTLFWIPRNCMDGVVMSHKTMELISKWLTFLLRFRMSQKLTSESSPPERRRCSLFLLKSREYTSPEWAFLDKAGFPSIERESHLDQSIHTYKSFRPAVLKRKCEDQNETI